MIALAAGLPLMVALAYWLWLHARGRGRPSHAVPDDWPAVDVLVPTLDEAEHLPRKLANLEALDYPADRLAVWIVDAGSTDGTVAMARRSPLGCRVLVSPVRGKAAQLTAGLREGNAPLVMVTDADTTLPPDALRIMAAAMAARPEVGAIGTSAHPARAHALEHAHWRIQNRLRAAEAAAGHAGLLVAPCYLFRRALIDHWPTDVVADDAYVGWEVARRGAVVGHVTVDAVEWRAPRTLVTLAQHKLRKTHAYTRELARAFGNRRAMPAAARAVLAWRVALSLSLAAAGVALAAGVTTAGVAGLAGGVLAVAITGAIAGVVSRSAAAHVRHGVIASALWLPLLLTVLAAVSLAALVLAIVRRPPDPHRRVPSSGTPLPDLHP